MKVEEIMSNKNTYMNMEEKNVIIIDGIEYTEYAVRELLSDSNKLRDLKNDMDYDYEKAVEEDVREYIDNHYDESEIIEKLAFNGADDWRSHLIDDLFCEDSVTGNASGSYTFSTYQAKLYLFNNMDLYEEACEEFGGVPNGGFSPESADVTIRCYLLGRAVESVIDNLLDEYTNEIEEFENRDDEE